MRLFQILTLTTVQAAIQWLEDNQDKPLEDLQAEDAEREQGGPAIAPLDGGENAKSLVCNECGKKFRNPDLASFHASKTSVRLRLQRPLLSTTALTGI